MKNRDNIKFTEVISQLRLPLIILVTFAHSYGGVEADYSLLSSSWDSYEFLKLLVSQTLVKTAVPTFFFISGYLFFLRVTKWDVNVYLQKMRRRVKTLLVPYVVWNLLMAVKLHTFSWQILWNFWCPAGEQIDWLGQVNQMTAPVNLPLWFLRDLMVVSLLSPLVYILLRRLGIWFMAVFTLVYLSGIGAFPLPGLSVYAFYFFCLGAFFSISQTEVMSIAKRFSLPILVSTVLSAFCMLVYYHTVVFSSLMLIFRLVSVFAVLLFVDGCFRRVSWRLPPVLVEASYFVYLSHFVFFFSFIDSAFFSFCGTSSFSLCVHYLLCPLIKASILVGLYCLYRRIKQTITFKNQ